ncbi:unnamed protein product [Zymoseptoria tritici ST99CH_1E4]|uniref:F-box domain-containing protein n=1 Tax=Zymoseptoria tritici ST99CH_1E4 TaxID=1276532 RepID=A0A2H1GQ97_ZYMTR|nr:unnamed protein product [Zymoseptoria tritici ST99CH_1E4]
MARYNLRPRRNADIDTDVPEAPAAAPDEGTATANAVESGNVDNMTVMATQQHPATSSPAMDLTKTGSTPVATTVFNYSAGGDSYEDLSDEELEDYELFEEAVSFSNSKASGKGEVADLQMSPVNTLNRHKALETTEICEQVLNNLSELEILRSLRVSRGFKAIIKGSITL